jgi:hypothetical protein
MCGYQMIKLSVAKIAAPERGEEENKVTLHEKVEGSIKINPIEQGQSDISLRDITNKVDSLDKTVQQLKHNEDRLKQVLDDKLKALRKHVDEFLDEPDEEVMKAIQKVETKLKHAAPTRQEFNQALTKDRKMVNDKAIKFKNSIEDLRQQNSWDRDAAASSQSVLFVGMGLLTLSGLLGIVYSVVSGIFKRKNAAKEKKRIDDEMEEMRAEIRGRVHARDIKMEDALVARTRFEHHLL